MFPKMDPRQMAAMMKKLGINNEEIPATRVVIETPSGKKIIIDSPSVVAVDMQGQKSFQVSGSIREIDSKMAEEEQFEIEADEPVSDEKLAESDVAMVAQQAKISREKARALLEESSGDIAEAIMKGSSADYLQDRKGHVELASLIGNVKSRELKEKMPLLFESNENDHLKAISVWHQMGREKFSQMIRAESPEVREALLGKLGKITNAPEGEKTLVRQELRRKATELNGWF
ncbi:MAG: nascent polypeptide-associated complex protein [Candidatus Micrarchaeota archaeon]